jgi:hypothetical protein
VALSRRFHAEPAACLDLGLCSTLSIPLAEYVLGRGLELLTGGRALVLCDPLGTLTGDEVVELGELVLVTLERPRQVIGGVVIAGGFATAGSGQHLSAGTLAAFILGRLADPYGAVAMSTGCLHV